MGHANPQRTIREFCKGVTEIVTPSTGGTQRMKYIKEADIYRLVMRSTLPEAEKFQDWVCEEVLPQIRKTGGYIPVQQEDNEQTILAKAMMIMQKTIDQAMQQSVAIKGANVTRNTVKQMLKNWKRQGLVENPREGIYRKL